MVGFDDDETIADFGASQQAQNFRGHRPKMAIR